MKAFLTYRDRDFDLKQAPPPNAAELTQDLNLNTLFVAMAAGDAFLLEVARTSLLESLNDLDVILYRQQVLADCLEHSDIVREIYAIAAEAGEAEKKVWRWLRSQYAEGVLHQSLEVLNIFVNLLKRLRQTADNNRVKFHSEGFTRFLKCLPVSWATITWASSRIICGGWHFVAAS